jgi:hypothetical protein
MASQDDIPRKVLSILGGATTFRATRPRDGRGGHGST